MTVNDFIKPYVEFHMGQRKNQTGLKLLLVRKGSGKTIYGEDMSAGTFYMKPEYRELPVLAWFFDYKNRKIILSVPNNKEE